jgi:uncharacterized integral membrane protein
MARSSPPVLAACLLLAGLLGGLWLTPSACAQTADDAPSLVQRSQVPTPEPPEPAAEDEPLLAAEPAPAAFEPAAGDEGSGAWAVLFLVLLGMLAFLIVLLAAKLIGLRRLFGTRRRAAITLGALAVVIVGGLVLVGLLAVPSYEYSPDQLSFLDELGRPEAFTLTFEADADGEVVRFEEWFYYTQGVGVVFRDGLLTGLTELEPLECSAAPVRIEPRAFDPAMRWKDVRAALPDRDWSRASEEYPQLADDDIEVYYADDVMIGMDAKRDSLVFVEALSLPVEAGP